jgi:hypothetical protein
MRGKRYLNNSTRDLSTIRKKGIEALTEKLGPVGMVEFIRQFDSGYGDYTKERHEWLDDENVADISMKIRNK